MTSKKQFASQRCWNSSLKINLNDILDMGSNGGDTAMNRANTCRDTSLGPSERPQDEDGSGWTRGWTAAGMAPEPGPSSGHQGQAITLDVACSLNCEMHSVGVESTQIQDTFGKPCGRVWKHFAIPNAFLFRGVSFAEVRGKLS